MAELNWDAESDEVRLGAVISKAIQQLDLDQESVFAGRIQTSDDLRDAQRCITLASLHSAIEKSEFYIAKRKHGVVIEYGPLWSGDNYQTLARTVAVLNQWFKTIKNATQDWWEKGSGPGGGLSMNDGVVTCINVLRSVFQHLDKQGHKLPQMETEELIESIQPYGTILSDYLGAFSEDDRAKFRELRGVQGVVARTRRCQKAIKDRFSDYNPEGLEKFLEQEKAQTNSRSKEIIDEIERTLQKVVLEELRREFGEKDTEWWIEGVPKAVRLEVTKRWEEEDGKRGGKENYFDLIHYRKIAIENWEIFQSVFGFGKANAGKDKGTSWMNELNEMRKPISHASSGVTLTLEDLSRLEEIAKTLQDKIAGRSTARINDEENEG